MVMAFYTYRFPKVWVWPSVLFQRKARTISCNFVVYFMTLSLTRNNTTGDYIGICLGLLRKTTKTLFTEVSVPRMKPGTSRRACMWNIRYHLFSLSVPVCTASTCATITTSYRRINTSWSLLCCLKQLAWNSQILKWINQPDAAISQVYYLSFKYSSTCFGHPHAHHQELNCSSSHWFTVGTWW